MKLFISTLLISAAALAGVTDNQVDFKIEKDSINLTPKTGFHLNAEAPASAVIDDLESLNKPTTKTEKLFSFRKNEKAKKASLSFYVCDDKKTVCEKHEQNLDLKNGAVKKSEVKSTYNNIKELNLKSANGKPTLLVFSAPWCPACIRMITETYHKPEVEKELKKLNFVKLNSDLPENNELADKFHIKAIPSLILLDKNGNETYRWLDFQKSKAFAKDLQQELQKVDLAESVAASAKLGDPSAASAMAFKAYNALDYGEAYKWFSLTTSAKDQKFKLASEVSLSQEKADDDEKLTVEYLNTLQKAITLTTSKFDQMRWTLDYFTKKSELKTFTPEAKTKAEELVKDLDSLIKNSSNAVVAFKESTYGDYSGFEKTELLWMKGKLSEVLEDKKLTEETHKAAIAELSKKALSVDRPGELLLAISYLREAGDTAKAEEFYKKLITKYPTTYVYYEKYSRFSQKNKNLDKALELVNEALKYPEGNRPQLGLLKSQILKDLNKKSEAVSAIDEALKTEGIEHKRYAGTLKKLNSLKAEIQKQ